MSKDLHLDKLSRLKKIEGQVRGIHSMIEEDRYCIDVLNQIKAVKSAIHKVESSILETHLDHCVTKAINSTKKEEKKAVLDEVRELLKVRIK